MRWDEMSLCQPSKVTDINLDLVSWRTKERRYYWSHGTQHIWIALSAEHNGNGNKNAPRKRIVTRIRDQRAELCLWPKGRQTGCPQFHFTLHPINTLINATVMDPVDYKIAVVTALSFDDTILFLRGRFNKCRHRLFQMVYLSFSFWTLKTHPLL